ncbi:secretogranin-1 isoform X4 [Aotus nancymaae]|uniref:secretogranin-1 isoform X4 n=1 Tax=Aotus nancymaae TaxID=37293 RepID=UPI0030FE392B
MAAEDATSGSLSEESSALDLPSACDIRDYVLQRPSQDTNSEAFSSVEFHSFPCSSDVDPDTSNLNTEQNNSWASENFWLDLAVKGQSEKEDDDGLRKSLDRFYEMFGHPQPGAANPLSASVCKCLSQKITQLREQESQSKCPGYLEMPQFTANALSAASQDHRASDADTLVSQFISMMIKNSFFSKEGSLHLENLRWLITSCSTGTGPRWKPCS